MKCVECSEMWRGGDVECAGVWDVECTSSHYQGSCSH